MAANLNMYKKTALTLMRMARDLVLTDVGERIPTIAEYTEIFDVSRGIVQNVLEALTEDGSITIEKRGVLGTFLTAKDNKRLYGHTGWGSIVGSMPIPLTPHFTSLATGVCEVLTSAPVEFSFAYMSGSVKRVEALTYTAAASMCETKYLAAALFSVIIASLCPVEYLRICSTASSSVPTVFTARI